MELSIVILTFREPERLACVLESLERLAANTPTREVLVMDRDVHRSGLLAVNAARKRGMSIRYEVEPLHDAARARLRAAVACEAPYVAFAPERCAVHPAWLEVLYRELRRSGASGALGRQDLTFDDAIPDSLRDPALWNGSAFETGSPLPWALWRFDGLLIDRKVFIETPVEPEPVDDSEEPSTSAFRALAARGVRIAAVDRALTGAHVGKHETRPSALRRHQFEAGRHAGGRDAREKRWAARLLARISTRIRLLAQRVRHALTLPIGTHRLLAQLRVEHTRGRLAGLRQA